MPPENEATKKVPVGSVKPAVDRASSVMPLNDSSHIDPQKVRQKLVQKRDAENAAKPVKLNEASANVHQTPETPPEHLAGFDKSPENTAKEKMREDMPKTIEKMKEQNRQ